MEGIESIRATEAQGNLHLLLTRSDNVAIAKHQAHKSTDASTALIFPSPYQRGYARKHRKAYAA